MSGGALVFLATPPKIGGGTMASTEPKFIARGTSWWNSRFAVAFVSAVAAAVVPITTATYELFKTARELKLKEVEQQQRIKLETLKQMEQVRLQYLSMAVSPQNEQNLLRILRYLRKTSEHTDPDLASWANEETAHVNSEIKRIQELREQLDKAHQDVRLASLRVVRLTDEARKLRQKNIEESSAATRNLAQAHTDQVEAEKRASTAESKLRELGQVLSSSGAAIVPLNVCAENTIRAISFTVKMIKSEKEGEKAGGVSDANVECVASARFPQLVRRKPKGRYEWSIGARELEDLDPTAAFLLRDVCDCAGRQ
jgi:hypothetical protein